MQQAPSSSAKVTTILWGCISSPSPSLVKVLVSWESASEEVKVVLFYVLHLSAIDLLSSGGLPLLLGWPSILMTGDNCPCSLS